MTSVTRSWYGGSWVWSNPPGSEPEPKPVKKRPLKSLQKEASGIARGDLPHGLVMGRFLPVHKGHQFLVEHARRCSSRLTVLIAELRTDPIPGTLRETWVRELCPDARILRIGDPDLESFAWDEKDRARWIELVEQAIATDRPDALFTSDEHFVSLSGWLKMTPRSLDPGRKVVPISGTAIRSRPLDSWSWLTDGSRAYYARRVCILGPEGSGKTTLAAKLATDFGTRWVPEQTQFLAPGRPLAPADLAVWLTGQNAAEDTLARQAEKILFCDGGAPAIQLWSQELFGAVPEWLRNEAARRRYDLYLVVAPREDLRSERSLEERKGHYEAMLRWLEGKSRWKKVEGSWDLRDYKARLAVEELLAGRP